MADTKDTFTIKNEGPIMVVSFHGSGFLDEEKIDLIGKDLIAALSAAPKPLVVLDMSNVRFCSSSILGKFVALYKTVVGLGGKIKFAALEKSISELFRVTKLDRLFEVHPDVRSAVKSFN
jgi:anti-sigma B factor antagonist